MDNRTLNVVFGLVVMVVAWMVAYILDLPKLYFIAGWWGCLAWNAYRGKIVD